MRKHKCATGLVINLTTIEQMEKLTGMSLWSFTVVQEFVIVWKGKRPYVLSKNFIVNQIPNLYFWSVKFDAHMIHLKQGYLWELPLAAYQLHTNKSLVSIICSYFTALMD